MGKKSFIIYQNWAEIIKRLPTEDAGELIKAICSYETGDMYDIKNPYVDAIFEGQIKPQLDEDAEKYAKEIEKRSEAGKKGMKSRWGNNKAITNDNNVINPITNDNTTITKITDTDTVTVTDTDNNNINNRGINAPSVRKFIPPTIEEVRAYCKERQNKVDPDAFINFYESKGWMIGKNKMKDWKAAVRTWEKNEKIQPITQKKPAAGFHNFEERKIDCNDLMKRFVRN